MNKRATIRTVAERAGVSRGTVDRVLNNRAYVRADVRERVLAAIRETGYISPREAHACAIAQGPLRAVKLGVLLPNWAGVFKTEVLRGLEDAHAELCCSQASVKVCTCETDIPSEAIALLNELLAWGAEGIALCALNDIAIEAKVNELVAAGIPCITFNSDLPNSRRLCFVGQDYAKSGRIAAELMSKCISPRARVLALVGNLEYQGHRARLDGFCTRMRALGFAADRIEVAETYNDYRVTYNKVAAALQDAMGPRAIYMVNRSVTGCTDAVRAEGQIGQVRVIGHDVSERTRAMLLEGSLDFTITQDLYRQGYQPLVLLRDLLQKGSAPDADQLSANICILCSQNID